MPMVRETAMSQEKRKSWTSALGAHRWLRRVSRLLQKRARHSTPALIAQIHILEGVTLGKFKFVSSNPPLTPTSKHMTIHTRPHNCPIQSCTRNFATRKDLTQHLHDRHSDNYGRTSVLCNHSDCADEQNVFGRRDNLRRHWRLCHGRNPRHDEAWFVIA